MADTTKIEWTDATWQIVTGCSVVSPGCTNCYAMRLAGTRLRNHPSRLDLTVKTKAGPVWNGMVRFNVGWLKQPIQWTKPRMIFVAAHGDLFHEAVQDWMLVQIFAVMAITKRHTYQVLTKRAERMRRFVTWLGTKEGFAALEEACRKLGYTLTFEGVGLQPFPLPNVWLGVSTEDQPRADERIPELLATPAAVRWISAEPLLGPLDLMRIDDGAAHREVPQEEWGPVDDDDSPPGLWWDALTGERTIMHGGANGDWWREDASIDWVVAGGESGPGARPMHPDWVRSLRDQCQQAGVPFFFKQWGAYGPGAVGKNGIDTFSVVAPDGRHITGEDAIMGHPEGAVVARVGKKRAGHLLNGVEHREFPT